MLHGIGREAVAQLAILPGAILYACAVVYGKKFAAISPTVAAASTMIRATVCLIPLSLIVDPPWNLRPSATSLLAALVLAVLCTGVAQLLCFRLVPTLGSMGVASRSYLRAGVSVVLGIVILGETITPMIGLGLAAIIAGVAVFNIQPNR